MGCPCTEHFFLIFFSLIIILQYAPASTTTAGTSCSTCFGRTRAVYYSNSEHQGTETGACEYGVMGATLYGGDVSASAKLYRDGVGCGACYQVRCTNRRYCSREGVTVVITDHGASDGADFILSMHAFANLGQSAYAGTLLVALGVVDVEYRRVSCSYPNKNITFKMDHSADFPYYFAFQIWFQQGDRDIVAVQLCETESLSCKLVERSHGAVWAMGSPPEGPLSVRMLLSGEEDRVETWLVPPNDIPEFWRANDVYDSGIQVE
ncbi:expansin-like B1 [Zingiber officinale]|uniref:expansin-like B1 n=1 Tax=Zingiber officinale TaxID=94328 RepID=UPI001C4D5A12|nr:expansin-like B1 [Zingiber officinale]